MSSLCALNVAWLKSFQRSQDGLQVNWTTREKSVKCPEQSKRLDTGLHGNLPLFVCLHNTYVFKRTFIMHLLNFHMESDNLLTRIQLIIR